MENILLKQLIFEDNGPSVISATKMTVTNLVVYFVFGYIFCNFFKKSCKNCLETLNLIQNYLLNLLCFSFIQFTALFRHFQILDIFEQQTVIVLFTTKIMSTSSWFSLPQRRQRSPTGDDGGPPYDFGRKCVFRHRFRWYCRSIISFFFLDLCINSSSPNPHNYLISILKPKLKNLSPVWKIHVQI